MTPIVWSHYILRSAVCKVRECQRDNQGRGASVYRSAANTAGRGLG